MSHILGARQAQKQQTRQSLLDAGLRLLEHQSLSSLVEESFGSLRALVRAIRAEQNGTDEVIDRSIDVIARFVHEHRAHLRFLVRERHGGVRPVRDAIAVRVRQFADDLADDLAAQPESEGWDPEDVRMLAELYADHTVTVAAALLEADEDPEAELRITEGARRQLRLISIGRRHWLDG